MKLSDSEDKQNLELYKLTAENALKRIEMAVTVLEGSIKLYHIRDIISSNEIIDQLLDIRAILKGD